MYLNSFTLNAIIPIQLTKRTTSSKIRLKFATLKISYAVHKTETDLPRIGSEIKL